jgi:hypothetical protein
LNKDIGLINKYYVERRDGKIKEDAKYFVLDLANDPGAVPAIVSYIGWCAENGYTELGADLESMLEDMDKL